MVRVTVKDSEDRENREAGAPEDQPNDSGAERASDQKNGAPAEESNHEDCLEKLERAEETAKKNFDLYLRSQADIENMKKRFQREKEDWLKFSNESLIKELLPVMDNLEKAIAHSSDENSLDALREGVELTLKGLKTALEKAGLKEVKALGEPFDPNFHEAMCEQEDQCADPGTVLQEYQKGYLLNERLIRPSMVIVSRKPGDKGDD